MSSSQFLNGIIATAVLFIVVIGLLCLFWLFSKLGNLVRFPQISFKLPSFAPFFLKLDQYFKATIQGIAKFPYGMALALMAWLFLLALPFLTVQTAGVPLDFVMGAMLFGSIIASGFTIAVLAYKHTHKERQTAKALLLVVGSPFAGAWLGVFGIAFMISGSAY